MIQCKLMMTEVLILQISGLIIVVRYGRLNKSVLSVTRYIQIGNQILQPQFL